MKGTNPCTAVIEPQLVYSWRPGVMARAATLSEYLLSLGLPETSATLFITREEWGELKKLSPNYGGAWPQTTRGCVGYLYGMQIKLKREGDPEWLMPTS